MRFICNIQLLLFTKHLFTYFSLVLISMNFHISNIFLIAYIHKKNDILIDFLHALI